MEYLIGVDSGGTYTKAVLYTTKGKMIYQSRKKIETLIPKPGFVEREHEEVWRITSEVIREVIKKSDIDPKNIKGISFSGHGKGLYLIGKEKQFIRRSILSTDNRAAEIAEEWEQLGYNKKLEGKIYQKLISCQIPTLVKWLKKYEPNIIEETKWIFGIKDFLRYMLTGKALAEITDFSGSGLVNLNTSNYDYEILQLLGIEDIADKLPPLIQSEKITGYVTESASFKTGLPIGCPVIAGAFDVNTCAIASGVINSDYMSVICGTWGINSYISKKPVTISNNTKNSIFCISDYYLVEESSPTSASNLEWAIDTFGLKELANKNDGHIYEKINRLVEKSNLNLNGPIFSPFIYGSNISNNSKASLIGLDARTDLGGVLRAIYEGVGFGHKFHIDELIKSKSNFKAVRLAGGLTNSKIWTQILCDIINLPLETTNQEELGALGAIIIASTGIGLYKNIQEAVEEMVSVRETYHPNTHNALIYNKKYKRYLQIIDLLSVIWKES